MHRAHPRRRAVLQDHLDAHAEVDAAVDGDRIDADDVGLGEQRCRCRSASSSSRSKSATTRSSRSVSTSSGRMSGSRRSRMSVARSSSGRSPRASAAGGPGARRGGPVGWWCVAWRPPFVAPAFEYLHSISCFRSAASRPGTSRPRSGAWAATSSPDDSPRTRRTIHGARCPVVQRSVRRGLRRARRDAGRARPACASAGSPTPERLQRRAGRERMARRGQVQPVLVPEPVVVVAPRPPRS